MQNSPSTTKTGQPNWLAMLGIGLGVFMATLDASIVNISLPTLVQKLNSNFATIQWVVLSYVLILTSLMLGVARLGDMFDKKKLYMAGLGIFSIGSLLCGLSPNVGWLIAFRALQGLGAALTQALGAAIITEIVPPAQRGRALGIIGSTVSIGIAVGPALGGVLIGLLGWRSVFLVNVPVGLITLLVIRRFVPSSSVRPGQRFDTTGALILFLTLGSYAIGMTFGQQLGFRAPLVQALLIAATVGLLVFLFIERRIQQPMIDLRLFRNVLFSLNLLMGFLVFMAMSGFFIMPFFLENVKGFPITQVGLIMMANPIVMGLVAPLAGSLSDRFGSRGISMIGLVVIVAGCLSVSTLSPQVTALGFILRLIPFGLGQGLFQSPNNSAIMGAAPRDRLGVASGLLSLSRTLGNTTGMPLMGALFASLVAAYSGLPAGVDVASAAPLALVAGINGAYRIAAFIIVGALALAALALWIDTRRKRQARAVEARVDGD